MDDDDERNSKPRRWFLEFEADNVNEMAKAEISNFAGDVVSRVISQYRSGNGPRCVLIRLRAAGFTWLLTYLVPPAWPAKDAPLVPDYRTGIEAIEAIPDHVVDMDRERPRPVSQSTFFWDAVPGAWLPVPEERFLPSAAGPRQWRAYAVPPEEIAAGAAALWFLGKVADAYVSRLAEVLAESTVAAARRIRLRRAHRVVRIDVPGGSTVIILPDPITDDAREAFLDLDPTADGLSGKTLYWHPRRHVWAVAEEPDTIRLIPGADGQAGRSATFADHADDGPDAGET